MRAFAYIRVSKEREGGISPAIQLDEITRYCEAKGWTVAEVFRDLDMSASRMGADKRPALQEMLRRAEDGECDVVVFYAVDRLARRMEDHYAILASLRDAGVAVDSVGQPYDGSPEGSLMWDLSAALAAYGARQHGRRIRDSHRKLKAAGRYSGGHPPYGFRRIVPGPGLEPDPDEAPTVLRMFDWVERGWTVTAIARHLNQEGVPTRTGKPWLASVVYRIVHRPEYAGGRMCEGRLVTGGNIAALIPPERWRKVQTMLGTVHPFGSGRNGDGPIPTRIIRCGSCGHSLRVHYRSGELVQLRCWATRDGACERGVSIYAHLLERELQKRIIRKLRGLKADPPPSASVEVDLERADDEIAAARVALERLAVGYADGIMEAGEYQDARRALVGRLERAQAKRARQTARVEKAASTEALRHLWSDLGQIAEHPEILSALPDRQRRELYEALLERVVVYPHGTEPRIHAVFRW